MGDVDLITKIFDKLSLGELMKCRDHLSTAIMTARGRREHEVNSKRVQDYVVVDKDFAMDTVAAAGVVADLECLNFRPNKTHPVTKWLTTSGLTYSWDANKDHQTVKQPVNLEDSKFIHTLMLELNKKLGVTFNSCLASYYSDGTVYARLHDDNEESLDQSVPITVVSLGGERVIDFLHKGADGRSIPAHSITAVDGGLYSMLPGCQEYFKHRVNSNLGLGRFSLSFRRIKTTSDPVSLSCEMVDLQTYRCRIGQHCHKVSRYRLGGQGHLTMQDIFIIVYNIFLSLLSSSYFYGVGLLIGLFYSMILCLALTQSTPVSLPRPSTQLFSSHSPFYKVPLIAMYHIKVYNVVLMFFSFRFLCCKHARYVHKISRLLWFRSFSLYISNTCTFKSLYLKFGSNKRFNILVANIIMWLSLLNFLLISIVNPSMLNPGPNNLSVLYQNVRGLVPFSHLRYDNPSLDVNKILELQSFVAIEKPDIVALNETWLKPSIGNNEIFSDNQYKIFRADRSKKTHPPDPLVTAKIRENGGGVLLGIRSDLDVVSKNVKVPLGVEMIAIQLTFSNGEKAVICTCYRVGTLGTVNCEKIAEFLRSFLSKRRPPKLYMIGDFNLARAVWDNPRSPVPIEQNFIDNFSELGLTQCITTPTHIKGNILDILLTNADNLVNDINVRDRDSICKSDHFPITFNISGRSRYKNSAKRKCYNFKRANWDALNHDLRNVDWSPLNCCEIETGWELIKSRLFELVDEHIPVVHIKSEFQPPWFDSDTFNFCRKKERLRQKFKRTGELKHELEFVKCRRDFKKLVSHKMRENLSNDDDPALITKNSGPT
jgi:alkylated DNA repair dioxygenase AlkB/endonuclease/exonuclease/phosphatase family metal-dependent hydrolase